MSGEAQRSTDSDQPVANGIESEEPLYLDEVFWYKLDVDYENANTLVKSREEGTPDNLQDALLSQFSNRKKPVITAKYKSVDVFKETVVTSNNPRYRILYMYANYLWIQNSEGDHVKTRQESIQEINAISDSNSLVVEKATDEFSILWPGSATIEKELDDGEVVDRRYLKANPVILKESDTGFEVRGRNRDRRKVSNKLRSDESITEIEPEKVDESVVDRIKNISTTYNDQFKIIGVKFERSSLPQNSRLQIRNERAIYDDLDALEAKNVASVDEMSNISKISLKDVKKDNKFSVSVNHNVNGFVFELEANQKLDQERTRFKDGFNAITGLEFRKIYNYGAQDQKYLLNNILAEDGEAYDRYYDSLGEGLRKFVDDVVKVETEQVKECLNCSSKNSTDSGECENCGVSDFTDSWSKTVLNVDDDRVLGYIDDDLIDETPEHDDLAITNWSVNNRKMAGRAIARANLNVTMSDGRGNTSSHHRINIIPIGNHPKPGTIDSYLLKTIFITYGESETRNYQGYGRISLYDYLKTSNKSKLVGKAIQDTITGLGDRISTKASEAQETAEGYFDVVDKVGSMHDHTDQLNEYYNSDDGDYFEKHVFYLSKSIFKQSERWGRQFESEPDGLLIIPKIDSSDYFVATYDAKISHSKDGYDLDKAEEDKALRYMLEEETREGIENKTDDKGISGHVFISQNFDQSDFGKVAGNIEDSIQDYTGERGAPVVFMEYRSLFELYNISQEHWRALGDSRVGGSFHQYIVSELERETTDEDGRYVYFNSDSVSNIRSKLLDRIDSFSQDQLEYYPGRTNQ